MTPMNQTDPRKPTHKGEYVSVKEEKERASLRALREKLLFMPHRDFPKE